MKPITIVLVVALAAIPAGCLNKPGNLRSEKVIGGVRFAEGTWVWDREMEGDGGMREVSIIIKKDHDFCGEIFLAGTRMFLRRPAGGGDPCLYPWSAELMQEHKIAGHTFPAFVVLNFETTCQEKFRLVSLFVPENPIEFAGMPVQGGSHVLFGPGGRIVKLTLDKEHVIDGVKRRGTVEFDENGKVISSE
jgi:hypothetical protein